MKKSFLFVLVLMCSVLVFGQDKIQDKSEKLNGLRFGFNGLKSEFGGQSWLESTGLYLGYTRDFPIMDRKYLRLSSDIGSMGVISETEIPAVMLNLGLGYLYRFNKIEGQLGVNTQLMMNERHIQYNLRAGAAYPIFQKLELELILQKAFYGSYSREVYNEPYYDYERKAYWIWEEPLEVLIFQLGLKFRF